MKNDTEGRTPDAGMVPVLYQLDPDTGDATGTVMPFCSTDCRDACGALRYPGLRTVRLGHSRLSACGFNPQCEHCGGDIKSALEVSDAPRRPPARGYGGGINAAEVMRVDRPRSVTLLYSHDDGFTRHAVEIFEDGTYHCRLNESVCFRRGTHEHMAKLHGYTLTELKERMYAARNEQRSPQAAEPQDPTHDA